MRIEFTKEANESLEIIVEYLFVFWSENEVNIMLSELDAVFENITQKIIRYPFFYNKIQFALIGNLQVKVFFEIKNNTLFILYFHSGKQNPSKLDFLKK